MSATPSRHRRKRTRRAWMIKSVDDPSGSLLQQLSSPNQPPALLTYSQRHNSSCRNSSHLCSLHIPSSRQALRRRRHTFNSLDDRLRVLWQCQAIASVGFATRPIKSVLLLDAHALVAAHVGWRCAMHHADGGACAHLMHVGSSQDTAWNLIQPCIQCMPK